MRFLPALLARLCPPVPLMDAQTEAQAADPIARDLNAAVSEHERVASDICDDYRSTINELLERIGRQNDP